MTHPDDEQTPFVDVERHLVFASQEITSYLSKVGDVTEPMELCYLARHLQVLGGEVRGAYKQTRTMASLSMGEKFLEIPGVGTFEAKEGKERKWRFDDLVRELVARLADESTEVDPDTGEVTPLPPAAFARLVATTLQTVFKFDYARVGALEAIGLKANDFCDWEEKGPDLKLPPLGKDDDPIAFSEDDPAPSPVGSEDSGKDTGEAA